MITQVCDILGLLLIETSVLVFVVHCFIELLHGNYFIGLQSLGCLVEDGSQEQWPHPKIDSNYQDLRVITAHGALKLYDSMFAFMFFSLMQRKHSEPNTYIDNLPKRMGNQEDLYDDVDIPEATMVRLFAELASLFIILNN